MLGTFDLAALENGGRVEDASDRFYSPATNTIQPGRSRKMDDGWETRRRRDKGNDWIRYRLAGRARDPRRRDRHRLPQGQRAGWAGPLASRAAGAGDWFEILPRTRLQPDTRHRFRLDAPRPATHVRLDIYPDGGVARLRLTGRLTAAGYAALALRWFDLLPAAEAEQALTGAGLDSADAAALTAARPLRDSAGASAAAAALPPAGGAAAAHRREAVRRLLGI